MNQKYRYLIPVFLILLVSSCKDEKKDEVKKEQKSAELADSLLKSDAFDTVLEGKKVGLYWLERDGIKMAMTNYGGRIVGLWVPDTNGDLIDVVVGFNSIKGYLNSTEPYFGATIGRVGNRIAKGSFELEGKTYSVPTNNGENSLHGGNKGFQDVVWDAEQINDYTLVLSYVSSDMEEGFPGNLTSKVTYSITEDAEVVMEYEAFTDKPTVVNLTNHAFFNLNGEGSGSILNHELQINGSQYTPVDEGLIPTGKIEDVANTPFDFTSPFKIGDRINESNEQLKYGMGYDHNYVLTEENKNGLRHAATVVGDKTGIVMDVFTEEPGLQFYSGNFMASKNTFKSGSKDDFRTAFCLETQHYPDAPNQPNFPSIRLNPGEKYHTVSKYKFSTTAKTNLGE